MSSTFGKKTNMPEVRIGVFICHCGSNIAGYLDCEGLTKYAGTLPGVVFALNNLYTCSEAGIAEIRNAIEKHNLNRVVVASCSPRTHMPLFKSACAQAGMNPYLFEMVNIRDQCSWVHMQEKEDATAKAMDLVRMGVAKAAFLEPQDDIESSCVRKALVIGGGVAGLSAAEAFADMGVDVTLVEKSERFGGIVNQLHRLAPEGVEAGPYIQGLIDLVTSKANVTTYMEAEVTSVEGVIGKYEVTVRQSDGSSIKDVVGCIVVTTGAVPFKPEGMMGYDGRDVITQFELEEKLRQGPLNAKRVVMIQCVGARSQERAYCSKICCMTAVKNALLIKESSPDSVVHVLYRDMQMYGTELERMLWEARSKGIRFDVYDASNPPAVKAGEVDFYQPLMGETQNIPCDLVVLSTPMVARDDVPGLSQLMRVAIDQNQFFLEAHAKLRPLDFATDGIFVAGCARYPATVGETRAQGLGAASRASTVLFKDKLVSSALIAEINAGTCVGCQGCMDMCPYGAIRFDTEKGVCEVNMILCKGCGNCASTCPSQSVKLKGFTPIQLLSQIREVVR